MKEQPRSSKLNLKRIIPILLAMTIAISSASVGMFILGNSSEQSSTVNNQSSAPEPITPPEPVEKIPVNSFNSITVTPGEDFLTEEATMADAVESSKALIDSVKTDGFDSIELTLNFKDGLLFTTSEYTAPVGDLLKEFYSYAKSQKLTVITSIDVRALVKDRFAKTEDVERICSVLANKSIGENSDMLVLKNCYILPEDISADEYPTADDGEANEQFLYTKLNNILEQFYLAAARSDATLYTGVEINENNTPHIAVYDYKTGLKEGYIDFAVIFNSHSTELKESDFKTYFEGFKTELEVDSDIYCKLDYSKIGSDVDGWEMTDQILRQLTALEDMKISGIITDGWNEFANDTTESRDAVKKFFADQWADDYVLKELSVSRPEKKKFTTYDSHVMLTGASDPSFKLTLNGEELERTELGYFSLDLDLEIGLNTFKIEHKGVTETYKITYKKLVIKSITPTTKQSLASRSVLLVGCVALSGSTVTAKLGDTTVTLQEEPILDEMGQPTGEYSNYSGRIELPLVYDEDKALGKVTFTAKSQYGTETEKGANITVIHEEREKEYDIGEVINWQAETFSATDDSDYSRPTNNYLPQGTVDYCIGDVSSSGGKMKVLRYGKMVYTTSSKGVNILKVYKGKLPDHNEVTVASVNDSGRYTQLTLDVMWKAPFTLDVKPQKYTSEKAGNRDYTIKESTFEYVEITFSYAKVFNGDISIPENNPIFSKAEIIKNKEDHTLRLYLKKKGMFYGWSAEYNSDGQLVFSFLNPARITTDETNSYGYRLDGITVVIDVGHGGNDIGAVGSHGKYNESQLNLTLSEKLKKELEAIGATVYLSRYDNDTNPTAEQRMKLIRDKKADFAIAIHRNASSSTAPRAFNSYHFNAFSANAAKKVYAATEEADLYKVSKWSGTKWHYFYGCRQSDCPVVLTENGFITNAEEYSQMIRDDFNDDCAKALTQGIVDYFASIQ